MTQEPENGGDPCPDQSESVACNDQSCDADCELADWGDWSLCSKACDGGHEIRTRNVEVEAQGLGECVAPDSEQRFALRDCNTFDCLALLPHNRTTLQCTAMIDVIILLDGSGSLGQYGWDTSKGMALQMIQAMQGGESGVKLGLLLFSGPDNWNDYAACTGGDSTAQPDDATCGMTRQHSQMMRRA